MAAHVLPVENLASAFAMGVARGAPRRVAQGVQRVIPVCAFPMVGAAVVSSPSVQKGLREAPNSARLMEEGRGVLFWGAPKGLKGALSFARDMEVASDVIFKEAVCVRRVSMVGPSFVLLMAVGSGVRCQTAPRVQGDGQIFVCDMGVGNDARS